MVYIHKLVVDQSDALSYAKLGQPNKSFSISSGLHHSIFKVFL